MTKRQTEMQNIIPESTELQKSALTYIHAEDISSIKKDQAKKRKTEMGALANKLKKSFVKVRDEEGFLHTFSFESEMKIKHTKVMDKKLIKKGDKTQ